MSIRSFAFLSVCAVLVGGCISKRAGVPMPETAWRIGETSRRDVVALWGNPDKTEGDVWIWKEWNLTGSKLKAAYMMIGMTVANSAVSTRQHRLEFDGKGLLVRHETVDSVPGGAEWSPWPW